MRILVIFRGSPASGKSTFINEHNLEQYTLSADDIRVMHQAPVLTPDGGYAISCENDKKVWNALFNILEERMIRGEFVVIDATNSKTSEMNKYKKLAESYRYRIICIDMTDIPIDECKRRNALRKPSYKIVPEYVIDTQYSRFETQQIPSGIKTIKPHEFEDEIKFKTIDLSNYKKIHHIGDIHGCYTALNTYFKDWLKEDEMYIFTGDFCDRGIENGEVLNFLFNIMNLPNVILLTGNHERHLWNYANDIPTKSKEFEKYTKAELDNKQVSKKNLRILYRKLRQVAYYTYGNKKVIVTHGGLSSIPDNLQYIATEQLICGVGQYEDMEYVNNSFVKNTDANTYQIHGHRNINNSNIKVNDRCFCLEGGVEFGGNLRIVTLDKNGFETIEIPNDVFRTVEYKEEVPVELNNIEVINLLRSNKFIRESKFDNISSFNFTQEAFRKGVWDEQTIRARGLFFNTNTGDIVVRSYNKFFNINEKEFTKIGNLKRNLVYPVTAYVKYNGYLGLIGYDKESDKLIISSKSNLNSQYSTWFEEILYKKLDKEKIDYMKNYLKENECTLVWEVIAPKYDTHMIEYKEDNIILLNIVHNTLNFEQFEYEDLVCLANDLGVEYKEKVATFNSWNEFKNWYDVVIEDDYKFNGEYIEGFVIEDSNKFMTKIKLQYYSFWKFMRSVKDEVYKKGHISRTSALTSPLANNFYGWLRGQKKETLRKDIIELRNMFYEENFNKN